MQPFVARPGGRRRALGLVFVVAAALAVVIGSSASSASGASGLKTGLKVFVIPKNLGNNYFTVADSVKTGGALSALKALGETGSETSGSAATSASQLPAIQSAITKGANALIVSATDPTALCPTLKRAMAQGIKVVTYDADAPTCRNMFINQASTSAIGTSEVDLLAQQIHSSGQIAIVSAAASAPNQNVWIGYMKTELKKYPNMKLVSIVYGNDDPTTATQVTSGLLQKYPNLKGREDHRRHRPEVLGRQARLLHDRREPHRPVGSADCVQQGQHRQVQLLDAVSLQDMARAADVWPPEPSTSALSV
jgi:rhamnose transport system substrate-binding protein